MHSGNILWRSVLFHLVILLTAVDAGGGQSSLLHLADNVFNEDDVIHLLREQGNKWANAYLPVAVSPTSPCGKALRTMLDALENVTSPWALSMVDAWGKSSDGIAFGNFWNTGLYDECVAAASPDEAVKGKYCHVTNVGQGTPERDGKVVEGVAPFLAAKPHLPWLPHFHRVQDHHPRTIVDSIATSQVQYCTCMPHECTARDLQTSVAKLVLMEDSPYLIVLCNDEEPQPQFTNGDVGFMGFIAFIMGLIVCSSLVDVYLSYTGNTVLRKGVLQYLLVFSAYTNLGKILQVNPQPAPGTINCLNGMRVLSMTWVIFCHQQSTTLFITQNILDLGKYTEGILAQTITNGYPSVDTFFFLSGLLVTYSILRELGRSGKFNVILYFFHRLIRLLPPIAIVIGFMSTVLRFFVSGPYNYIWSLYWQQNCIKYWWRDIALVNNFMYETGECLGQAWYVAVDMQLYIIAPIVVLPLFFFKAVGKAVLFTATVVFALVPTLVIWLKDLPPTNLIYGPPGSNEYFKYVYMTPWCRAEPWIAGVWLGYIFYKQGNNKLKMSPLAVTVGWSLAAVTGLLVVYGMLSYNHFVSPAPYEVMTQLVYGGGHRLAWGAALAWVVLACHNGYGGVVDDFLSHPVWQPIGRLTYTTYLVAFPMQFIIAYCTPVAVYYNELNKIIEAVGALVLSLPAAVFLSLIAESPIMGLEKLLLRPGGHATRTNKQSLAQASKTEHEPQGATNSAFNHYEGVTDQAETSPQQINGAGGGAEYKGEEISIKF